MTAVSFGIGQRQIAARIYPVCIDTVTDNDHSGTDYAGFRHDLAADAAIIEMQPGIKYNSDRIVYTISGGALNQLSLMHARIRISSGLRKAIFAGE